MAMGRKTKLTPGLQEDFCKAIQLGMTYKLSCAYVGISEPTFYRWLQEAEKPTGRKAQKDFRKALKAAEAKGAAHSLAVIRRAADDGNWTAAAWILERRHGFRKEIPQQLLEIREDAIEDAPDPRTQKGRDHIITEVSRLPEEFLLAALSRKVEVGEAK